ncbi:MAG: GNAT family N-acetyltransferase [Bacteroidales bacterium]|nr:GNAT family N-acetyltransferase [Bacteroidales bacterium]
MRILESERLIMKPVEPEDLPYLMEQRWDADLTDHIIHNPISTYNQQQWYEKICRNGDVVLAIFFKKADGEKPELLGAVGLYDFNTRHQRATIKTMRIPKEYQGLGIASEALCMLIDYGFNTLNLNKITCDTFADNFGSIKHLEKVGFQREGCLKQHYFHQGKFKDALIYSLLREDFNRNKEQH